MRCLRRGKVCTWNGGCRLHSVPGGDVLCGCGGVLERDVHALPRGQRLVFARREPVRGAV